MYKSARDNVHYHRIDERVLCVSLHIICESKITFYRRHNSRPICHLRASIKIFQKCNFFSQTLLNAITANLPTILYLFYYPTTYFQFDLCFFPKNSNFSFFSSFLNFSPSSKLELMMSIVCGCLSAQVKSTIFQIATCKVSQVK